MKEKKQDLARKPNLMTCNVYYVKSSLLIQPSYEERPLPLAK
jgi:hypothetical protein